jgi:hypothetical protein
MKVSRQGNHSACQFGHTRTIRGPALDYDKNRWSYASIPTHTFKA